MRNKWRLIYTDSRVQKMNIFAKLWNARVRILQPGGFIPKSKLTR